MKRLNIREILKGAVAETYNIPEEALKSIKTYKLKEMMKNCEEAK